MTIPDWTKEFEGEEWDTIILGGVIFPGVAHVSSKKPDDRDKQKGRGKKRSRTVPEGEHDKEFQVELVLADVEEGRVFVDTCVPLLMKRNKNGVGDPLEITHPLAMIMGVDAVTIGDVEIPPPSSMEGWRIRWSMSEWTSEPAEAGAPKDKPVAQEDSQGALAQGQNPPPTLAEQIEANSFGSSS